jgi:hypothetical protein
MMKARLILAFALLTICTGAALAQTPDMLPPSRETICDLETGAAFGLCNAYCEAMDCESASPQASESACSKVQGKFQNITGRDVTCELPCPCTSIPQFNAILANASSCVDFFGTVVVSAGGPTLPFPPFFAEYAGSDPSTLPGHVCGYVNLTNNAFITIPISDEQAATCVQMTRDAATNNGVTCQTFP